ncbi:MAG TPA: hypothetical protein VF765_29950 [Polyangiaceae bacterium]
MRDDAEQRGVLATVSEDGAPTIDHGCHQIIDAAAALQANLEVLAGMRDPSAHSAPVIADMRASVDRIVALARALRGRPTPVSRRARPRQAG